MNKRIRMYAAGISFALACTGSLFAGMAREIGKQSREGLKALPEKRRIKQEQLEVERIKKEQIAQGKIEELIIDAVDAAVPAGTERLTILPEVPGTGVTATSYTSEVDFQTALLAALRKGDADFVNGGAAGITKVLAVAKTRLPNKSDAWKMYNAIKTAVNAQANKAGIQGAVVAGILTAVVGDPFAGALEAQIILDIRAAGPSPTPAGIVHEDTAAAAAAFGVVYQGGRFIVKRPFVTTQVTYPGGATDAEVLHFRKGDFNENTGFFVGLDPSGNYGGLIDDNKQYALSNVAAGSVSITPLAPKQVTLNAGGIKDNPIFGKGLSHLRVAAGDHPVVVADDQTYVHVVTDPVEGRSMLTNKSTDLGIDYALKGGNAALLGAHAKIFDIAATNKPVQYYTAGGADADKRNLIAAAVANDPDLKGATDVGIAMIAREGDHLRPLKTDNMDQNANPENNKALKLDIKARPLSIGDSTWAADDGFNKSDINLCWDDQLGQFFGTVAGLKPEDAADKAAFGLFRIKPERDALALEAVAPVAPDTIDKTTPSYAIFGALSKSNNAVVNLYNPGVLHTSTGKHALIVSGGVGTDLETSSKAWVNALPLTADGTLAKKDGTPLVNYEKDDTPHISRQNASAVTIDEYTPYIVGRSPMFLASVAGSEVAVGTPLTKEEKFQAPSFFGKGSILAKDSRIQGRVSLRGDGGVGVVKLDNNFQFNVAVPPRQPILLTTGLTFDQNFQLGIGTEIAGGSNVVLDTQIAQGDLTVEGAELPLLPGTVIAAESEIKRGFEVGKAVGGVTATAVMQHGNIAATQKNVAKAGIISFPGYDVAKNDAVLNAATNAVANAVATDAQAALNGNESPRVTTAVNQAVAGGLDDNESYKNILKAMGVYSDPVRTVFNNARTAVDKDAALGQIANLQPGVTSFAPGGALTTLPQDSVLKVGSSLAQTSKIKQKFANDQQIDVGAVVTFDTTKPNDIPASVTDCAPLVATLPAGLHQAKDNPAQNALNLLLAGATKFAQKADFTTDEFKAEAAGVTVLGVDDADNRKVDSKVALRSQIPVGNGKTALASVSNFVTTQLAGVSPLADGLAVTNEMARQLAHPGVNEVKILNAGLAAALDGSPAVERVVVLDQVRTYLVDDTKTFSDYLAKGIEGVVTGNEKTDKFIKSLSDNDYLSKDLSDTKYYKQNREFIAQAITAAYAGSDILIEKALRLSADKFVADGTGLTPENNAAGAFVAAFNAANPAIPMTNEAIDAAIGLVPAPGNAGTILFAAVNGQSAAYAAAIAALPDALTEVRRLKGLFNDALSSIIAEEPVAVALFENALQRKNAMNAAARALFNDISLSLAPVSAAAHTAVTNVPGDVDFTAIRAAANTLGQICSDSAAAINTVIVAIDAKYTQLSADGTTLAERTQFISDLTNQTGLLLQFQEVLARPLPTQEDFNALLTLVRNKAAKDSGISTTIPADEDLKNIIAEFSKEQGYGLRGSRATWIRPMIAKAVEIYSQAGKDKSVVPTLQLLKAFVDNDNAKPLKMAQAAVDVYTRLPAVAGDPLVADLAAATIDQKILNYVATKDKPQAILASAVKDSFYKYAEAGYELPGFIALKASNQLVFTKPETPYNKLFLNAFDALAIPKYVGPDPVAEFSADKATITFQPGADLALDGDWRFGPKSELHGLTVDDGKTWQFGAGTTLTVGTQLPAWTLFNKGLNVEYPNQIDATAGFNAGVDVLTPVGGQWMLGKIADFTQAERAKLSLNGELTMQNSQSSIKIAGNRTIQSDVAAATHAGKKYIVTIPAGTVLPAGTKISSTPGYNENVGEGILDFSQAANTIAAGGDKTLSENFKTNKDWTLPDGLTVEFPAYPTKLVDNMVLPQGTRIEATDAIDHSGVIRNDAGQDFKTSTDAAALNFTAAGTYVLPEAAKIVGGPLDLAVAKLKVTNDPLFTPGIINGSFKVNASEIALPYTPAEGLKLRKHTPQTFAPGSVIKQGTNLNPAVITVANGRHAYPEQFTAYAAADTKFAAETCLARGSKFVEQDIKPAAEWTIGAGWQLGTGMVLPEGTEVILKALFNADYSAIFKDTAGNNVAAFDKSGGAIAGDETINVPAGGYKIAADVKTEDGVNKFTVKVPATKTLSGGTLERVAGTPPAPLNAALSFAAREKSAGVVVAAGSVLADGTKLQTGFEVVGGTPLKTDGSKAENLKINNADGKVTALDTTKKLTLKPTNEITNVTVGVAPLKLDRDLKVGAGADVVQVAGGSTLAPGTQFKGDVILKSDLIMNKPANPGDPVVADVLPVGSVIHSGSQLKPETMVATDGGKLTVQTAALKLNTDFALALWDVKTKGETKATAADTQLHLPDSTEGAIYFQPPGMLGGDNYSELTLNADLKLEDNARLDIQTGGEVTLAKDSTLDNAYVVTHDSPYATSSIFQKIIGDTVYIALEGDRTQQNGVEAGIFKSTAVFDQTGAVRGWTPWTRVGVNMDAVACFGRSEQRGDVVYLTSKDGKAFVDVATNSVINPATTIKRTGWGDVVADSLSSYLAPKFDTGDTYSSGTYGVFDFGPDTRGFKVVNRRNEDPYFSMMVVTGYERVAIAQTGKRDGDTFVPVTKFDDKNNVKMYTPDQGLSGLGQITCAELTRNELGQNWLFVGGNGGLAVLASSVGKGFGDNLSKLNPGGLPQKFLKLSAKKGGVEQLTNVRKIVADEATRYVYVVTKDAVLRINPSLDAFKAQNARGRGGELVMGVLTDPDKDFVVLADVPNSKYNGAGGNGELLTKQYPVKPLGAANNPNAEFTDLVILQSKEDAEGKTKLLLATTAGIVTSDEVKKDFAGDDAALQGLKWNKSDLNARVGDPGDMGAVLRMQPVSLQPSGTMVIDKATNTHTFEGNLYLLATDKDSKELRQYRLNATKGEVKPIAEKTNKNGGAFLPYFVKYAPIEPTLVNDGNAFAAPDDGGTPDLERNFFQARNEDTSLDQVPDIPSAQLIADAITAAAGVDSIFDLETQQGVSFDSAIYNPSFAQTVNSATGSLYIPSTSGVLVNE